jgi:hypothetical protein
MVSPEWQGVGLGTALQVRPQEYAMRARRAGFVSEILPHNVSMQRLAPQCVGHDDYFE